MDFALLRVTDVASVGGKSASLGEMISQLSGAGVRVPGGIATTADAYRAFLPQGGLDRRIEEWFGKLPVDDVKALAGRPARSADRARPTIRILQDG